MIRTRVARVDKQRIAAAKKLPGERIRWGLCCQFVAEPIRFHTTTATHLLRLRPADRIKKLSQICWHNTHALAAALRYCAQHRIGCFRIKSNLFPAMTHPQVGYELDQLPESASIIKGLKECGRFAAANDVRTVFHPDPFIVLNSPRKDVLKNSIKELENHAQIAEWLNVDVINIHAGGSFGNKTCALESFVRNLQKLSAPVRARLTIENDDRLFTPTDLLPLCRTEGLALAYDAHHHRCLPDSLSLDSATRLALRTWNREPLFHLSSPLNGWRGPHPNCHHDFINPRDFPNCWRELAITIEIEAKAKELAVDRIRRTIRSSKF